jgi:hypothetical protein
LALFRGASTKKKRKAEIPKPDEEKVPKSKFDIVERDKKRLENKIKELKSLKDVHIPAEQHKKVLAEKERLLQEIQRLRKREEQLLAKSSEHEGIKEEYKMMRSRIKKIVENLAKVETLFNHFFSGLSIDIIFLLLERHPESMSTTDVLEFTGGKRKEVLETLKVLHRDKWLDKSVRKGFPRTNIWKLNDDKAMLLRS